MIHRNIPGRLPKVIAFMPQTDSKVDHFLHNFYFLFEHGGVRDIKKLEMISSVQIGIRYNYTIYIPTWATYLFASIYSYLSDYVNSKFAKILNFMFFSINSTNTYLGLLKTKNQFFQARKCYIIEHYKFKLFRTPKFF